MHGRPNKKKARPGLESLEERRALSAGAAAAHFAAVSAANAAATQAAAAAAGRQLGPPLPDQAPSNTKPLTGYLVYRITQPNRFNNHIVTPIAGHVLVQLAQPIPGHIYNVLYITVRNGTTQTFNASSNFYVKFPGQPFSFPIMTGDQTWAPGQNYTFYVLTNKYYPLPDEVASGFVFSLGGAISIGIPGPSGIFLRMRYNPATINRNLDAILLKGAGSQGGKGIPFGLPVTSIYEFSTAATQRNDFGGYF